MNQSAVRTVREFEGILVGDRVIHPTHGDGVVQSAWHGCLDVQFDGAQVLFKGDDSKHWVPTPAMDAWRFSDGRTHRSWMADVSRRRQAIEDEERAKQEALLQKKEAVLAQYRLALSRDYFGASGLLRSVDTTIVSVDDLLQERRKYLLDGLAELTGELPPDDEQIDAISATAKNLLVVARLGSGKTETLANRAAFLVKKCRVLPGELMLLAFNRKAAEEMSERLARKLNGAPIPHVMTFHALAYCVVHPLSVPLHDEKQSGQLGLSREFQRVINDLLLMPAFQGKVRHLMLAHFRADWERIVGGGYNLAPAEMIHLRRSLVKETIRGEYVKSYGEKRIANFLLEHGVPYDYERNHWWNGRNYRPDFTVSAVAGSPGVVVEYLGLAGDSDYDAESAEKREYWRSRNDKWIFLELSPSDIAGDSPRGLDRLREVLRRNGHPCRRVTDEELWPQVKERAVDRFSSAVTGFVGRCRKTWILPDSLCDMIANHEVLCETESQFLELAIQIQSRWE